MNAQRCWLRCGSEQSWTGEAEDLWRAAEITQQDAAEDGTARFVCCTCDAAGEVVTLTVGREDVLPRDVLPQGGVCDLVSLGNLHGPAIIDNLRLRFSSGSSGPKSIYTYCGHICIAVNPYERLHYLYTRDVQTSFHGAENFADNPPHLYAIAEAAFKNITRTKQSQSILVSGESGAGKTESVKIMMKYLAERSQRGAVCSGPSVADAVVMSTPLLETFGNCKTLRNNNSSRFGKFTQILFDGPNIIGSRVEVYLLEKSRIVQQHEGERTYHIFYQIMCADELRIPGGCEFLHSLDLPTKMQNVHFFASQCWEADGIDDQTWFHEMLSIMSSLGIGEVHQKNVLRIVAAVLHLGQIAFSSTALSSGDDKATVVDGENSCGLNCASRLLCCSSKDLQASLVTRHISARTETYTINLTQREAQDARDALAKALYAKLFAWLVSRINLSTAPVDAAGGTGCKASILDIFGFESFAHNSLEQFLINFANEKLQQQFTWYVFKIEQKEYDQEGIVWNAVTFKDNQPILDVIEGRISVLSLLDEECRLQRGTDASFVQKLKEHASRFPKASQATGMGSSTAIVTFPMKGTQQPEFIVQHYAGRVHYTATAFRAKNMDSLHSDMIELVQHGCVDPFVNGLFTARAARPTSGKAKLSTLGAQFKAQLSILVDSINTSSVHYVRCVKPNAEKSSDLFDIAGVGTQLRCQGILEAIRISREAYPNRTSHEDVVKRYGMCIQNGRSVTTSHREQVAELTKQLLDEGQYQVGETKVFFKREGLEKIEALRGRVVGQYCLHIQTSIRCFLATRSWGRTKIACAFIQRVARGRVARNFVRQQRAATLLQALIRGRSRRRQYHRLLLGIIELQCICRASMGRKILKLRRRDAAAALIQCRLRGRYSSRRYGFLRAASIVIQSEARRRIQVRRYLELRNAAREDADLINQLNKLKTMLKSERECRLRVEAENMALLQQRGFGETFNSNTLDSRSAAHPTMAAADNAINRVRGDGLEAASPRRSMTKHGTSAPSPVGVFTSPRAEQEDSGWLGKLGGLLAPKSAQSVQPKTGLAELSSYDEEMVEALEKERHLLKLKLSQETRNSQRSLEEKDRKIKELQRRDLRATRKSAQEIGMLQEERKLRKGLEDNLLQEQGVCGHLRRELELLEEDRAQLKGIIRSLNGDGEDLKAENVVLRSKIQCLEEIIRSMNGEREAANFVELRVPPASATTPSSTDNEFSHASDIIEAATPSFEEESTLLASAAGAIQKLRLFGLRRLDD